MPAPSPQHCASSVQPELAHLASTWDDRDLRPAPREMAKTRTPLPWRSWRAASAPGGPSLLHLPERRTKPWMPQERWPARVASGQGGPNRLRVRELEAVWMGQGRTRAPGKTQGQQVPRMEHPPGTWLSDSRALVPADLQVPRARPSPCHPFSYPPLLSRLPSPSPPAHFQPPPLS